MKQTVLQRLAYFNALNKLLENFPRLFDIKEYQTFPCGGYFEITDINGNKAKIYYGEMSEQGIIFKDIASYQYNMDKVCYIGEALLEENINDAVSLIQNYLKKALKYEISLEETKDFIEHINMVSHGYTRRDFLKICNFQEEVAAMVFEGVDWQSPETYFDDMERVNEIFYLDEGIILMTEGMKINDYLYQIYKEDWCKQRGYEVEYMNDECGINGECYVCYDEFIDNELKENKGYYINQALKRQKYHVNHRVKIEEYCHAPVTMKEMCDYGYTWKGMIPVKMEDAKVLFQTYQIYKLYEDGTEAAIQSLEEFKDFKGLFGIEDQDVINNQEKELEK